MPNLAEMMDMSHLDENPEALKAAVTAAVEPTKSKEEQDDDDPRGEDEWTFEFEFKDGRGKVWRGTFVNKTLDHRDRQLIGSMRARFSGGMDFNSIDPLTNEINLMIAHMTFSLQKSPKWAEDLRALKNVDLLQALYGRVASHEAFFHGYGAVEA